MAEFTIYLGNKNYSSWSLRGWLMLKATGIAFDEVVIPLYEPQSRSEILRHTPSGKMPTLVHNRKSGGPVTVWESLAIGEYLAELFPQAGLWPKDPAARAHARAISNEMHAGFLPLRRHFPMNMRSVFDREIIPEIQGDIDRITSLWRDCRQRFGARWGFPLRLVHYRRCDVRAGGQPLPHLQAAARRRGRGLCARDDGLAGLSGMARRRAQRADDHRAMGILG